MKLNKIISIFLLILLVFSLASCGGVTCDSHIDSDGDSRCDECGEPVEVNTPCTEHTDANGDYLCDKCGESTGKKPCETHVDANTDGNCDECGEKVEISDGKTEYSVYVKDESGKPVAGVFVQVCQGESCIAPRVGTDEYGKHSVRLAATGEPIEVKIIYADESYEYDATVCVATFAEGETEVTVTLKKKAESVDYTLSLLYVEVGDDEVANAPIKLKNATVDVYVGGEFVLTVTTDEDGTAGFTINKTDAKVSVKIVSTEVSDAVISNVFYDFEEGETSLTVTLTNNVDLPFVPFNN